MRKQSIVLTAFVVSPVVVVAVLVWAIAVSLKDPTIVKQPPLGAGAGQTGSDNSALRIIKGANTETAPAAEEPAADAAPQQPDLIDAEDVEAGYIIVVQDKAGLANPASPIYLASNLTGWNPGDRKYVLTPQSDMRWRIILPKPPGKPVEFKFTRGSWELEELTAEMAPLPKNRSLPKVDRAALKPGEPAVFEFVVEKWGDQRPDFANRRALDPYRAMKVTGDVRRLQVIGGAGAPAGNSRELLVWLPPGYDDPANAAVRYPVIYMHDGQNLFEKLPNVPGEWMADETAQDLVSRGITRPFIIVGVPHSGPGRTREYMPIAALPSIEPEGDRHVDWLVSEVMPRVERAFRVQQGKANTAVGGSSLGAAISIYAASRHPDLFGMVLAESLPLRTGSADAWRSFLDGVKQWPDRIYLGMGGAETGNDPANAARNAGYVEAVRQLDQRLADAGLGPDRRLLVIEPAAVHNEGAWAARLPQAFTFLFPPPVDGTK